MGKPQITMMETAGAHGADLEVTNERLSKSGGWKRQRIVYIIPSADHIPAKVYLAHRNLAFPPNQPMVPLLAQDMEVGEAYSETIAMVLAHPDLSQWEFILTIEHDNIPPGDGVVKLVEDMERHQELACIGGLYFTKGPGGVAQIWGDPKDPQLNFRPQVPVPNTVQECVGTGMGFNLWRMSMFKDARLRRPWFKTLNGSEGTGVGTQDLYFWGDARKYGYRCAIDTSIKVGHYDHDGKFGPPGFVW